MDAVAAHQPPSQAMHLWRVVRRRVTLRRVRLGTGLVLFTYVTAHLTNHALGNASFDAMEGTLNFLSDYIWLNPVVTFVLYGSLLTHLGLGLWALYQRRWHSVRPAEIVQLVLGLSIPFILFNHIEVTRISHAIYGTWRGYGQELYVLWILSPIKGYLQLTLLVIAWVHGCIGLHYWLRLRPSYVTLRPIVLATAVLLPALAMLGYLQGSRMVAELSRQPMFQAGWLDETDMGTQAMAAALADANMVFLGGYGGLIALILLARGVRVIVERRGGMVRLTRSDGAVMVVPRGTSVLEAARRYKVPHASVCGGRGRCSTCRIWLMGDPGEVPAPSTAEAAVLATLRVGPSVRLACQLRPEHDLAFATVLPPNAPISRAYPNNRQHAADERMIVAMFVDMRGSTRLAERRLPYDTLSFNHDNGHPRWRPISCTARNTGPCSRSMTASTSWVTRAISKCNTIAAPPKTAISPTHRCWRSSAPSSSNACSIPARSNSAMGSGASRTRNFRLDAPPSSPITPPCPPP